MTKKRVLIVLFCLLYLCILSIAGCKTANYISEERIAGEENGGKESELFIELTYEKQNRAFFGIGFPEYTPYSKKYEWKLQSHIILYTRETGKTLSLNDVEVFLNTMENPDGSPRTWLDDETGTINGFVEWCRWNKERLDNYRDELLDLYIMYSIEHPEFEYHSVSELTPVQIIELDKKYLDPDYNLLLE